MRSALPITINEVRFGTSSNPTDQFIEIHNASDPRGRSLRVEVDPHPESVGARDACDDPAGDDARERPASICSASPVRGWPPRHVRARRTINVRSAAGFAAGQAVDVDGETRTIVNAGTAATPSTTVFIPVSTRPWLTIPVGATNVPVTNAAGFEVGQKIGIDIGGHYEVATVTAVGKAATQTTLAAPAVSGANNVKLAATANLTAGDTLTIGTGGRKERVKVASVGTAGATGTGVDLAAPLRFDHRSGIDVSDVGTGISFSPATKFAHASGDAVQALGSGITLDRSLTRSHAYGAPVVNRQVTTAGYQGTPAPNQWFGGALSARAGSIALLDASGAVMIDAMVYGSQQSNSSGERDDRQPGDRRARGRPAAGRLHRRGPGACRRPRRQPRPLPGRRRRGRQLHRLPAAGRDEPVGRGAGRHEQHQGGERGRLRGRPVGDGRRAGRSSSTAVIAEVGTAGATTIDSRRRRAGATVLSVTDTMGFTAGQAITIDGGAARETAVVVSTTRGGRPGPRRRAQRGAPRSR